MTLQVLKPLATGAIIGAIALAVVGFGWGGWMTASTAEQKASVEADMQVAAALLPFCLRQSADDPASSARIDELKSAGRFQRVDIIIKNGWATVPGTEDPHRGLASACLDALSERF